MRLALATYSEHPGITQDDALFVRHLGTSIEAEAAAWDSDVDWKQFDAVVVRTTWNYHREPERFSAWLDHLDQLGVRTLNSTATLRWNADKLYLRELEQRGHRIVPTVWIERGSDIDLVDLMAEHSLERAVIKPRISANSMGTSVVSIEGGADDQATFEKLLASGDAMMQPFLEEIRTQGEWSLIYIGGHFSHALIKRPAPGDYRVQRDFGASELLATPEPESMAMAEQLLAELPGMPLYARVDGLEVNGAFTLMELELIEPFLFFDLAPGSGERMARAIEEQLG